MISFSEISALGVLLEPEAGHFSLISSVCSLHNKTFTVLWNTLMEVVAIRRRFGIDIRCP